MKKIIKFEDLLDAFKFFIIPFNDRAKTLKLLSDRSDKGGRREYYASESPMEEISIELDNLKDIIDERPKTLNSAMIRVRRNVRDNLSEISSRIIQDPLNKISRYMWSNRHYYDQ